MEGREGRREGGRKEGNKLDTGQEKKAETNVHNLTQLKIQNLPQEYKQQKHKSVLIGFYAFIS